MKRKIMSVCCALVLTLGLVCGSMQEAKAASTDPILDGSYLTHDEESIGYDTKITRGVDLLTGYSKCVVLGPGEIYAGGTTIAAQVVDSVRIGVTVERAREGDDAWSIYDGWIKESTNTDRVSANRTLQVEGGYYYRVRCTHAANSDVSSSFTNGVYVE
ncbi:hypothetical protein [Faecalicatena contorta]|uniref:hypothetical protein n=1 Tax=Faecalicatena contorta TaxID=39482 RepID=UPI001F26EE25|nr:hypothetical protein [Faecalicatena contorta]MCF2683407.1 hypothetical protein [Faecalicatena contorta]